MGKYGIAAIQATKLMRSGNCSNPQEAWGVATAKAFPTQMSSRKKGCPRGAFLGLCEEGAVNGVDAGNYTTSKKNKAYALDALQRIRENPSLKNNQIDLWKSIMDGVSKVENGQMDVVISLWEEGYLS